MISTPARWAAARLGIALVFGGLCEQALCVETAGVPIKLSAYNQVEYCDLAVGTDGTLHAVFTERPASDKPLLLYYRSSLDDGKTWSTAIPLSEDESGVDASYARVLLDSNGRVYAVWKSIRKNSRLDGPGGTTGGWLVFRALSGGTWSPVTKLHDQKTSAFSWFGAIAPNGTVRVVWSQVTQDTPTAYFDINYANWIREATLDGPAIQSSGELTTPAPILTEAQVKELRAANKPIRYADTQPKMEGWVNLSGYVDAAGVTQVVGEHPGIQSGAGGGQPGRQIAIRDGVRFVSLYEFERYRSYNTFNNPPALVADALGAKHLIRVPEKSEKPTVRDYVLDALKLGPFSTPISPKTGPGAIANWQVHRLGGGKLAVTTAMSERGGYDPDDLELYVSFFDRKGTWTPATRISHNQAAQSGFKRETTSADTLGAITKHKPRFASIALGKDNVPRLLMVDTEDTLVGVSSTGVTTGGQRVTASGSLRTDRPALFYLRLPVTLK